MTTELDAVNTLLACVGESSINTLEVSGLADVSAAKDTLNEISREVQTKGWHFNTEEEYPLNRDASNRILLAPNVLRLVVQDGGLQVAQRGTKLYDKTNHRDTFEKDLKGLVVLCLPWDELPQVARHFIMIRASRVFQGRTFGSDTQYRFSSQEEQDAEAALQEAEGESGDYNMFSGSYSVTSIMER